MKCSCQQENRDYSRASMRQINNEKWMGRFGFCLILCNRRHEAASHIESGSERLFILYFQLFRTNWLFFLRIFLLFCGINVYRFCNWFLRFNFFFVIFNTMCFHCDESSIPLDWNYTKQIEQKKNVKH